MTALRTCAFTDIAPRLPPPQTRLRVTETAHLLAFGDLRGFYRAFKRWQGCTPAEFRRSANATERQAGATSP